MLLFNKNLLSRQTRLLSKVSTPKIIVRGVRVKIPKSPIPSGTATQATATISQNAHTTSSNSYPGSSTAINNNSTPVASTTTPIPTSPATSPAPAPAASSSSILGSLGNTLSNTIGSGLNTVSRVVNAVHPSGYIHPNTNTKNTYTYINQNATNNSFTTTNTNTTIVTNTNQQIIPINQVSFPPLKSIKEKTDEIFYNPPTLAVYLGEKKARFCFVSEIIIKDSYQSYTWYAARMFTHSPSRIDANGEIQYHKKISGVDIDSLPQNQFLTEVRFSRNKTDFELTNSSANSNTFVLSQAYKETKLSFKTTVIFILYEPIRQHFKYTGVINTNVGNMTQELFKNLQAKAITNDPTFFS